MAHNPTHPYVSSAREAGNRQQQQKEALQRNLAHRKAQIDAQKTATPSVTETTIPSAKKAPAKPAGADKPASAS